MSATCAQEALVLDIESCDRLAGRSGCGFITHGHGCTVVEVIDGPGPEPQRESSRTIWCRRFPLGGLPGRGLYRVEMVDVCFQGTAGCPSDPLGDPSGLF